MSRPYTLRRRAETVEETRRRITEAAVELHGTLGPARTTFSAVAERAGVQRLTLYRHFPDETALFQACTRHWLAQNPPPDTGAWTSIADPELRLRKALWELYAYYARTRQMLALSIRDAPLVEALREPMANWHRYLDRARDIVAAPWPVKGADRRRLLIAIGHALDFTTWDSLRQHGADPETAVALMCDAVAAAARNVSKNDKRQTATGRKRAGPPRERT